MSAEVHDVQQLDRDSITKASEIMLPWYPVFCTWLGLTWVFQSDTVLTNSGAVLELAGSIVPMAAWGSLMLTVAAIQVIALHLHRRTAYLVSLSLLMGTMIVWVVISFIAVIQLGAPWSAPAWPTGAMLASIASMRSLNYREVQK